MSKASLQLWKIIAKVKTKSKGDLDLACEAFTAELKKLDDAMLLDVELAFSDAMRSANNWDVWGAIYVIHGVVSDDMFWDCRAGLVALGQKIFEAAIENPDSLASVKDIVELTLFEGFQYVPGEIIEERDLKEKKRKGHGGKITGKKWDMKKLEAGDNTALERRFPRLWKRFSDENF